MGGRLTMFSYFPNCESRSAEIVRFNKDEKYLSDHYPVRAKLSFATN